METGMDNKPKKRPWFQFHLSTAIILMFAAAGLLWLNMRPDVQATPFGSNELVAWGWPFTALQHLDHGNGQSVRQFIAPFGIAFDLLVAAAILYSSVGEDRPSLN